MLNATLLEVECKKAPPAGPTADPETPKKANPIELVRVVAAVSTRRSNLAQAHEKQRDLMKSFAQASGKKKKKDKIEGDLACGKLRIAAAENWLKFTLKRWKLLSQFAKDNNPMTPKLKAILGFGDEQTALGDQHLKVAGTDQPQPELLNLTFDYGKNTLFGPDGKPYTFGGAVEPGKEKESEPEPDLALPDVPAPKSTPAYSPDPSELPTDADWAALDEPPGETPSPEPTPKPAEPEPEPEPAGPVLIDMLSDEQRTTVADAAVKAATDVLKSTGQMNWTAAEDAAKAALAAGGEIQFTKPGQFELQKAVSDAISPLINPSPEELSQVPAMAAEILGPGADASTPPGQYAGALSMQFAKKFGKQLNYGAAYSALKSEVEKLGTDISSLDLSTQKKVVKAAREAAVAAAWVGGDLAQAIASGVDTDIGIVLSKKGIAAALTGIQSSAIGLSWDSVSEADKTAMLGVASAAMKGYKDPGVGADAALKAAAALKLVHLSPDGQKQLIAAAQETLKKKPDEVGFLSKMKEILSEVAAVGSLGNSVPEILDNISVQSGEAIDEWATKYGIEQWTALYDKIDAIADEVALKNFDEAEFRDWLTKNWNELAKQKQPPDSSAFIAYANDLGADVKLTKRIVSALGKAFGYSATTLGYMYLAYDEWLTQWKKSAPASAPSVEPVSGAAPVPEPAPAPATPTSMLEQKPVLYGGHSYTWSKQKKISKWHHLTNGQRNYLNQKFAAAFIDGAIYTAAGEIGPKKIGAVCKQIQDQFKADWAAAGVMQMSLPLVKEMFEKALTGLKTDPHKWVQDNMPTSEMVAYYTSALTSGKPVAPPTETTPLPVTHWSTLGLGTQEVISDLVAELVKQGAPDIQQQIEKKYHIKLNAATISTLIDAAKASEPEAAPAPAPTPAPPPPPPAAAAPPAATLKDIPALYAALDAKTKFAITDWEKANVLDIWKKTIGAGKPLTPPQEKALQKFLTKAQKLLPPALGVPPLATTVNGPTPEIAATAPASSYAAAGLDPHNNPLGMTKEEIAAFVSLEAPPNAPKSPPESSGGAAPKWVGKADFFPGNSGAHEKYLIGTTGDPEQLTAKTFKGSSKADGAWMFKPVADAFAAGEVASNRLQMLLGLAGTPNCWTATFKGESGIMQWFTRKPSFRDKGIEQTPWVAGEQAVRQLQCYGVLNYISSEMDDHGGNFVFEDDGRLRNVDRGQAMKFFDSSHDAVGYLKWKAPAGVTHEDSKGLPKKLLIAWGAGETIPMMPLTAPEFEATVARAEALPSDVYKNMWRAYAEGAAERGDLAAFSTVESDKTVAGFLDAVDERRKKVRASIGAMYASLAKTRAAALKTKGDPRPVGEIEAEIRSQIGLDGFLQGGKVAAKAMPEVAAAVQTSDVKDANNWDDPGFPPTSRVPQMEDLKREGIVGVDMMVGGNDVKDGRAQFFMVGDNPFCSVWLEPEARARLQAMLGDADGFSAVQPQKPTLPSFTPPSPPKEMVDWTSFVNDVWHASGLTSDKYKADGSKLSKAEKHLDKWAKGTAEEPGASQYVSKAYEKAKLLSEGGNSMVKAVGEHYLKELLRIGKLTPEGNYVLKPSAEVPEDQRAIAAFMPSAELVAAQGEAAVKAKEKYDADVAEAKKAHDDANAAKLKKYEDDLVDYNKKKAEFEAKLKSQNKLNAMKLDHFPTPAAKSVKREADQGKMGRGSAWDGTYEPSFDKNSNEMSTYNIDLTDVVTGTAVAGGGAAPTSRLLINYVPDHFKGYGSAHTKKQQKYPGRNGQVRIQFPAGATREQITEMMKGISKQLGIDLRPAAAQDQELNYLRRMAWLRKLEGYSTGLMHYDAEPKNGTTQERIEFWAQKLAEGSSGPKSATVGYDPRYEPARTPKGAIKTKDGQVVYATNPDGTRKSNPSYRPIAENIGGGRLAYRRFDVSDAEIESYRAKGASLTHGNNALLDAVLHTSALLATERRANVGIMDPNGTQPGQSPEADCQTGGSNDIYAWLHKTGGGSGTFHFDVGLLAYTSAWAHPGDSYGSKVDYASHSKSPTNRAASVQEREVVEMMSSGFGGTPEVLLGDKVDFVRWATRINAGNKKKQIIEKLKAAGITHMGPHKKPVEEVVV